MLALAASNDRRRMLLSAGAVCAVILAVASLSILSLYRIALDRQGRLLHETVRSHARLIEAVAGFDSRASPGKAPADVLEPVRLAHSRFGGFGETGEYLLARRDGDSITFLVSRRHEMPGEDRPVPWESGLGEPMRRALRGQVGVAVAQDYRGTLVLAAYEPVGSLGWGLVAKIDLAEVRRPFLRAALASGAASLAVVAAGLLLYLRIVRPVVVRAERADRQQVSLDVAEVMLVALGLDGRVAAVNRKGCEILGCAREEIIGRDWFEHFLPPDIRSEVRRVFERVLAGDTTPMEYYENPVLTRAGDAPLIAWHSSLLRGPDGAVTGTISSGQDITHLAEMQRAAAVFHQAFKRSNDVMFYCDKDAVIRDVNDAFVRLYGYSREEALGQRPRLLRSRHSTDELYRRMWSRILDPAVGYWRGEIINRAKDGREIPLILTITAVRDPAGGVVGFVSNAIDMTEHLAMRHRVAQTEALASVGEMAAVVAHEIRNPLGSIVMAARQIATDRLGEVDRRTVLEILRHESQRLNETLTNFLAYARPRELRLQRVDLNALAQEVCNMVRSDRSLSREIRFSLAMDPDLKPFPLDPDQIRQVVWNVVLNAVQALDGRGELSLSTGHGQGWAWITVRDTGPGIPESSLGDIFKPFHTTKQQGTGLGLAIADRIVKAHGGTIEVESRAGDGAAFTVSLPWTEA